MQALLAVFKTVYHRQDICGLNAETSSALTIECWRHSFWALWGIRAVKRILSFGQ